MTSNKVNKNTDMLAQVTASKPIFKKPLLVGKVGKFPKKIVKESSEQTENVSTVVNEEAVEDSSKIQILKENEITRKAEDTEDKQMPLPYKEPVWSGMPELLGTKYKLEVLKSGSIIETIDLMDKPFWVFGRLENCDIHMAHPTISRYHAILQYRNIEITDQPKGFYLYDLASTHGTFLNKNKLKPRTYVKVHVGHLLKLGLSSRSYLLTGPECDREEESELSITELKQQRQEELARREEAEKETLRKREEERKVMQQKFEERGVDWGLGEDADEEADISENPFAQMNNEELYLDDPKKALRGFMEREGYDLEYDCTEQGIGQFLCKVELPLDDDRGKPITAEVLHKGKKKEAVIQCALEACRILDRYGLLRQATHESRKRKAKNWEENDFYDSDEDTFLDRTGTIEKKRQNRMKIKVPAQPETYQSLLEKETKIRKEISNIEKQLSNANEYQAITSTSTTDEDSLDYYMKELKYIKLDRQAINKLKADLSKLKKDLANIVKLVNIAKPTDLPKLIKENLNNSANNSKHKSKLPIFGKRLKVKVQMPIRKESNYEDIDDDVEEEQEVEEKEQLEEDIQKSKEVTSFEQGTHNVFENKKTIGKETNTKIEEQEKINNDDKFLAECSKLDQAFKMIFPLMSTESERCLMNIWSNMKAIHPEYSCDRKNEIINLFENYTSNYDFTTVIETLVNEINLISSMLKTMKTCWEIVEVARKLINLAKEITLMANRLNHDSKKEFDKKIVLDESTEKITESEHCEKMAVDESTLECDLEKKKKKNLRRMQQRQEKAEIEKQKGYEEDAFKEDYNMWVPPAGQIGDGRTSLNDKYGY